MNSSKIGFEIGKLASSFIKGLNSESSVNEKITDEQADVSSQRNTSVIDLTCHKCGAGLNIDLEKIQAFCPYCGAKLMIDVDNLDRIIAEKEKTRREELKYEHERWEQKIEDSRRPARIKATIVLAVAGFLMMAVGSFAGEATQNPDSSWYMISILGWLPLAAIPCVWAIGTKK